MHIPNSTYRVQLNKDFTFKDLDGIIDYLHALGISTIYASPITEAVPGSNHGYDVINPYGINPEIGTLEELKALSKKLKGKGMSWVQDIVPNHMAFATQNRLLMDVLERGPSSEYYHYFDINWAHPDKKLHGKLMVPVLESDTDTCIRDGKISLAFSGAGGFTIHYGADQYPLSASAYHLFARACAQHHTEFVAVLDEIRRKTWEHTSCKEWQASKQHWLDQNREQEKVIQSCIDLVNQDKELLTELLNNQYYTLAHYAITDSCINYRRFFTVNNLICLSMEDEAVFDDYHAFLHHLYEEGLIQGLRIDHIDGLRDPGAYLRRLRGLFGKDCYIIAEKILEAKENMPGDWPLQGTSGYEFLSFTNQVMTDRQGARRLVAHYYEELLPGLPGYKDTVHAKKKLILCNYMGGELDNLVHYFFELMPGQETISRERLREALALVMICLPVYRIYPERFPLREKEQELIRETFEAAAAKNEALQPELQLLHSLFNGNENDVLNTKKLSFLKRLMQFTGPLTAKGVEDTTFYVYNPLISHNEVGDTPSTVGISIDRFHQKMLERQELNPLSLNATSTHDTKRGEDARIRINVLSELPEEWLQQVSEWRQMNEPFTSVVNGKRAPAVNDEYFLYQSLVGGYPVGPVDIGAFTERLKAYLIKALRESKMHTSWSQPDEAYEKACLRFIDKLLDTSHSFLEKFLPFHQKISSRAFVYSLNQALIKITAPGIPDFYQGTELWDQYFVDPDNRNAVDYATRQQYLAEQMSPAQEIEQAAAYRQQGREKLYTICKALQCRKHNAELFIHGKYVPLRTNNDAAILAYARVSGQDWIVTITPLRINDSGKDVATAWDDAWIRLPAEAPLVWTNVFTDEELHAEQGKIPVSKIFSRFMPALLKNK